MKRLLKTSAVLGIAALLGSANLFAASKTLDSSRTSDALKNPQVLEKPEAKKKAETRIERKPEIKDGRKHGGKFLEAKKMKELPPEFHNPKPEKSSNPKQEPKRTKEMKELKKLPEAKDNIPEPESRFSKAEIKLPGVKIEIGFPEPEPKKNPRK